MTGMFRGITMIDKGVDKEADKEADKGRPEASRLRGQDGKDANTGKPERAAAKDEDPLEARRAQLDLELSRHRAAEGKTSGDDSGKAGYAQALKLSSEFIAGIFAGGIIGYLSDRFLGTAPWGMIVMLMLGFCAGVLNVLRSVGYVAPAGVKSQTRNGDDKTGR